MWCHLQAAKIVVHELSFGQMKISDGTKTFSYSVEKVGY